MPDFRACDSLPMASNVSSAKPIGSIILWQLAQVGLDPMLLHPLAHRRAAPAAVAIVLSLNAGTLGGGSGGTTPRMFISTHLPRRTGDVRSGVRRSRSACCPCRAGRGASSSSGPSVHAAEPAAVDVRECRSDFASRSLTNV